jgi:hypothetical protein
MTKHPTTTAAGDIGRRIAIRREELGKSQDEVAARTGIAPGYLRYVEQDATVPSYLSRAAGRPGGIPRGSAYGPVREPSRPART